MQGRIRKHDRVGLVSTQFFGVFDDGGHMLPRGGRKQLNPSLTDGIEGETPLKTYWGMGYKGAQSGDVVWVSLFQNFKLRKRRFLLMDWSS